MVKQKRMVAFLEILGMQYDLAILGSGFGGSITALIARQMGLNPILIEKNSHPRFSIGESSTPQASIALTSIAEKYNLPRLAPLARYGNLKDTYAELNCGPKRGFTYIHHPNTEDSLLIAASPDGYDCDSHWYRADLDSFLVNEVIEADIPYFENTDVVLEQDGDWHLSAENFSCNAECVIDATGGANPLGIQQDISRVRTNSRVNLFAF